MYEKNINIIMGNQIATSYVRKRDCYNQLKTARRILVTSVMS